MFVYSKSVEPRAAGVPFLLLMNKEIQLICVDK